MDVQREDGLVVCGLDPRVHILNDGPAPCDLPRPPTPAEALAWAMHGHCRLPSWWPNRLADAERTLSYLRDTGYDVSVSGRHIAGGES